MNIERDETAVSWPQIAAVCFPEIQKQFPEWKGRTLDEFIREWPAPVELVGSWRTEGLDDGELARHSNNN